MLSDYRFAIVYEYSRLMANKKTRLDIEPGYKEDVVVYRHLHPTNAICRLIQSFFNITKLFTKIIQIIAEIDFQVFFKPF